MLSAPDCSEAGRLSGRKTVRVSEKSNFTQTCSLLSQYLKNKGSFGDLSLGMTCNLEGKGKPETFHQVGTTMNLLPNLEISVEGSNVSERNAATFRNVNSMDLFPQNSGFGPSISTEDPKKTDFSGPATKAQMTIFYAGKVIVLDDFPADKAKEIMLLAHNSSNIASISGKDQLTSSSSVAPSSNIVTNSGNNSNQERSQKPPVPIVSDMPIARKASLHRFLEKRKDRISAKAPYQGSNTAATSSKPAESKAWLGLASAFKEE